MNCASFILFVRPSNHNIVSDLNKVKKEKTE